jgi:hypothetical protein
MYNNSFFLATEADQVVWLSHYALRLPLIGPLCEISPEEITSNVEHPIPDPTVTFVQGVNGVRVRIDFNKYGHDGIFIESQINNGDWVFLAINTVKPYYDERPLATGNTHETREYRMRWWDKSIAHGEWSAIEHVVLGS